MYCNKRAHKKSRLFRSGFSFIEIMIVVVIIGLLAGAVTLSTRHFLDKAKQNRARMDVTTYKNALESYYGEVGHYPSSEEGLASLVPKFVDRLRPDPWGRPYQYNFPGRSQPYEVVCFGADGRPGGDGADADISSEEGGDVTATISVPKSGSSP